MFTPHVANLSEHSRTPFTGVAFPVHGVPAPQGSKRAFVVNGRAVLTESSAKVKPWREAVVNAAVDAMNGREPLEGPVAVFVSFRLPRPKTVKRDLPSVRPDLDKLSRSTLDALTTAQVFKDDSQVCDMHIYKRYGLPGADITVTVLDEAVEAAA